MTDTEKKYIDLYKQMADLCEEQGWGDPFSYARSKEIFLAISLGHKISKTLSGADGIDEDGECEYKSTVTSTIKASYTGISVMPTWEEQKSYLENDKIAKYKNHYHARFEGSKLAECYKVSGDKVLELLITKLEKKYPNISTKKDPRLSAQLTRNEIIENGTRII